jgi:hypothetical protein
VSADFEDWTRGLELVTDDMSDFPDWTVAAQVTGGSAGGYASLTGPGQTATPGALDQEGPFTVNSGSTSLGVDVVAGIFNHAVTIDTPDVLAVVAGGIDVITNEGSLATSLVGWEVNTTGAFQVTTGGLIAQQGEGVFYGTAGAGVTTSPGIALQDNGTLTGGGPTSIGFFVYNGNPTGVWSPSGATGAICFDINTPALWGWNIHTHAWVAL